MPALVRRLQAVEELFLDKNALAALPEAIGNMAALRELNARQNVLTGLPASIGSLKNLEGLFLDRNRLEALPDLSGCVALAGINVSVNQLRGLPDGLCQCARMEGIFGDENEIAELPEHFGAMVALEEVSLNHNQINLLRPPHVETGRHASTTLIRCTRALLKGVALGLQTAPSLGCETGPAWRRTAAAQPGRGAVQGCKGCGVGCGIAVRPGRRR